MTVHAGETIAFRITNQASLAHEFVVGDATLQAEHEREMASGSMAIGDDAGYAVNVPAGRTATLVYTFDKPGTLLYGCIAEAGVSDPWGNPAPVAYAVPVPSGDDTP